MLKGRVQCNRLPRWNLQAQNTDCFQSCLLYIVESWKHFKRKENVMARIEWQEEDQKNCPETCARVCVSQSLSIHCRSPAPCLCCSGDSGVHDPAWGTKKKQKRTTFTRSDSVRGDAPHSSAAPPTSLWHQVLQSRWWGCDPSLMPDDRSTAAAAASHGLVLQWLFSPRAAATL